MELKIFKLLGLEKHMVIEYTRPDYEFSKCTRLAYFDELIEKLPKMSRKGRPEPPFMCVAHTRDKNGCYRENKEISLEEIMYLTVIGKSGLL